jgi:hypothetical protein
MFPEPDIAVSFFILGTLRAICTSKRIMTASFVPAKRGQAVHATRIFFTHWLNVVALETIYSIAT